MIKYTILFSRKKKKNHFSAGNDVAASLRTLEAYIANLIFNI